MDPKVFDLSRVPMVGGLAHLGELWGLTVSGWENNYPWFRAIDLTRSDWRGPAVDWLVSQGYTDAGESDDALLSALRACQASAPIEILDPSLDT